MSASNRTLSHVIVQMIAMLRNLDDDSLDYIFELILMEKKARKNNNGCRCGK